ncbi:MAG: class I SAM-dependent methyltransferase [Pseudomonadota bacterium]
MNKSYWNDIEKEKKKPFFIENTEDPKLMNFLQNESNLQKCFEDALQFATAFGYIRGRILEIGAGVAWTSALLSKIPEVIEVNAIDFSEHRLLKIAPLVFTQFKGNASKFNPIVGDFLNIDFDGCDKFDAVIFCQALYMFQNIQDVLSKTHSLLRQEGMVLITCERITPIFSQTSLNYWKKKIRTILFGRADDSGNYHYTDNEYKKALQKAGFIYYYQNLSYPIYHGASINAGNFFGIKGLK